MATPEKNGARRKPTALDLFCGAGGASMGLHLAGFDVVGVDMKPQPRYPFLFVQADALRPPFEIHRFDFIWASPPCQDYSSLKGLAGKKRGKLIPAVREMLEKSGRPFAIENVIGAELKNPIRLCGSMFGLSVWRHRLFECHPPIIFTPQCAHALCPEPIDVTGTGGPFHGERKSPGGGVSRKPKNIEHARAAMGIAWMSRPELSQAIPPAYAQYIGNAILASREALND